MYRPIFLLIFAALFAGCASRAIEQVPGAPPRLIRIDWFGHQCFRIEAPIGITILTNPFSPGSVSYEQPKNLQPEIVLVTTETAKTNHVDMVENTPQILRGSVGVGSNTSSGIRFLGVPIFRTPGQEDPSDMNVVYRWTLDGLRFCFLGDVRDPLSREDAARIGQVDVLFIPVDNSELTGTERTELLAQFRPRVIIPMGSPANINSFARGFTAVYRTGGNAALVSRKDLPAQPTVLVFRPPQ